MKMVKSINRLFFYGVKGTGDTVVYHRMKGFEELSKSLNPNEYTRKYVDEEFERSDITRYSPSISFSFDLVQSNAVHTDISTIAKNEIVGSGAVRSILAVEIDNDTDNAVLRDFSVILDAEDNSEDFYKYSGSFKANGDKVLGTATSSDDWQTATFTPSIVIED